MRAPFTYAVPLFSASQISLFRECQRKWAWRYIAKIVTPPHPSAVLGTEVHDEQLGPYLTTDRPFDFTRPSGYIAAALLEYLPKPKTPGMVVEKHFVLPSPASGGKFAYQGYVDLWLPDSGLVPGMPPPPPSVASVPFVGDFKTTSDLKWAKNAKALETDVQGMLYAAATMVETQRPVVDMSWMYTQTRGARKSRCTTLRVEEDHVLGQFKKIEETALAIFEAKQQVTDPLALPPSPSQCAAYGGCPYRDKCNLSPLEHIVGLSEPIVALSAQKGKHMNKSDESVAVSTSSLMANLKARKASSEKASSEKASVEKASVETASVETAPVETAPVETASVETIGINPPEKALPSPKRGPGRPKKVAVEAEPAVAIAVDSDPIAADRYPIRAPFITAESADPEPFITVRTQVSPEVSVEVSDVPRKGESLAQAIKRLGGVS